MSNRPWRQRFEDMLEAAERIQGYIQGMTYEEFVADRRTFDAVLHNLAVIGEAANYVPSEIQSRFSAVPWSAMVGMRIIIAHRYFRISAPHVWNAAAYHTPPVARQLQSALSILVNSD